MKSESIGQAPRAAQGLQNMAPVEVPCASLMKISLSSRRGAFFEVSNTPGLGQIRYIEAANELHMRYK